MALDDALETMRAEHLGRFARFVARQGKRVRRGAPEVKLSLGSDSKFFRSLYCADFVQNDDGGPTVVEMGSEPSAAYFSVHDEKGVTVTFKAATWDDMTIRHDGRPLADGPIERWFTRWFDPEDTRHQASGAFSDVIHSLSVSSEHLSIDFGTAPADAFRELLAVLREAGARAVSVQGSRHPPD